MSFGKMNTFAEITEIRNVKDSEGFSSKRETVLAFIRVYREGRHGSERWANLAAFSEALEANEEIHTDEVQSKGLRL